MTPATGNCLAMAVVQRVTGKDLAEPTSQFEQLTATFQTRIKEMGLLNLEDLIPQIFGSKFYKMFTVPGHP